MPQLLSAHLLPKSRGERVLLQPWDEFDVKLGAAAGAGRPSMQVGEVISPQVEVELLGGRVGDFDERAESWK